LQRFRKLASLPGFTRSILPGVSRDAATEVVVAMDVDGVGGTHEIEGTRAETRRDDDASKDDGGNESGEGPIDDGDDGEDEDQQDQELASLVYSLLSILGRWKIFCIDVLYVREIYD
jgi:hypothetical protein